MFRVTELSIGPEGLHRIMLLMDGKSKKAGFWRKELGLKTKCTLTLKNICGVPCKLDAKNARIEKAVKKDLLTHFLFLIALFTLIALTKQWIDVKYLPFLFGGIVGTLLPDVDYLINVYLLKPKEDVSQQAATLLSERKVLKSWDVLATNQEKWSEMLLHTANFQVVFAILAFLVFTSSPSLLGRGLVLAYLLHLVVDEMTDWIEKKDLNRWFVNFPLQLNLGEKHWYLAINVGIVVFLAFLI
jgi:hypothetical protein